MVIRFKWGSWLRSLRALLTAVLYCLIWNDFSFQSSWVVLVIFIEKSKKRGWLLVELWKELTLVVLVWRRRVAVAILAQTDRENGAAKRRKWRSGGRKEEMTFTYDEKKRRTRRHCHPVCVCVCVRTTIDFAYLAFIYDWLFSVGLSHCAPHCVTAMAPNSSDRLDMSSMKHLQSSKLAPHTRLLLFSLASSSSSFFDHFSYSLLGRDRWIYFRFLASAMAASVPVSERDTRTQTPCNRVRGLVAREHPPPPLFYTLVSIRRFHNSLTCVDVSMPLW